MDDAPFVERGNGFILNEKSACVKSQEAIPSLYPWVQEKEHNN